jgi:hypothetical protein
MAFDFIWTGSSRGSSPPAPFAYSSSLMRVETASTPRAREKTFSLSLLCSSFIASHESKREKMCARRELKAKRFDRRPLSLCLRRPQTHIKVDQTPALWAPLSRRTNIFLCQTKGPSSSCHVSHLQSGALCCSKRHARVFRRWNAAFSDATAQILSQHMRFICYLNCKEEGNMYMFKWCILCKKWSLFAKLSYFEVVV